MIQNRFVYLISATAILLAVQALPAAAQNAPKAKAQTAQPRPAGPSQTQQQAGSLADANAQQPQAGWLARCSSASRDAPLECAIEQTAVLTKTGQLVVLFNVRVQSDTRTPVALVQLPLGLNIPGGSKVQVDDGKAVDLPIQTCESRGCYASGPISNELLNAMKTGKELKVSFMTLAKETITIPMPLADFASAYDKIK